MRRIEPIDELLEELIKLGFIVEPVTAEDRESAYKLFDWITARKAEVGEG